MNDDKIKRRGSPYTTAAVKDGKSVIFFQMYTRLFLEVHQVNCPAGQMFFLNEKFLKLHRDIPTDLPEKMAYLSEFFHLMFFQLTLGNSNFQEIGENSSTYRKFELSDI